MRILTLPSARYSLGAVCLLALQLTACHWTTAHISSLKLGKDESVSSETNTFTPGDKVCAVIHVANVPSKVTVVCSLIAEKVPGSADNYHAATFDKSFDVDKDANLSYILTPGPTGWVQGRYRIEARMTVDGEQKSTKTAPFTVAAPPGGGNWPTVTVVNPVDAVPTPPTSAVPLSTAAASSATGSAHIAGLKVGKDAQVAVESSTFAPTERICALVNVAGVQSQAVLKIQLVAEKVTGQPENAHVDKFDKTFTLNSDNYATYDLTPGPQGWPTGSYRIEASVAGPDGRENSQKSASFSVKAP